LHQVRDKVRPSLIDVFDLRPRRVHPFLEANEVVVNAGHHQGDEKDQQDNRQTTSDQCFAHCFRLISFSFLMTGIVHAAERLNT
jgi:hypothetical protein